MSEVRQDAAYALRTLRRNPGFAVVAVLTLALAIGANTAIFSVAQTVLLKPLPYSAPSSLVAVYETRAKSPGNRFDLSAPNLEDYREQQHTLTGIAAQFTRLATWRTGNGDAQIANVTQVTANMFDVLGVSALRGRTFAANEGAEGANAKAILAWSFWQGQLGGDPAVIGGTMTIYNKTYDVIGVMPRGFTLGNGEAFWIPFDLADDLSRAAITRKQHVYTCLARVKPGVTVAAARADLLALSEHLETQYPEADGGLHATVAPLRETLASRVEQPVLLLLGAAALILLIACANLANVTLSRSAGRRAEMAVRAALGAGRARLARQLLTESVMLAAAGGVLGAALAVAATRMLLALDPNALPGMFTVTVDGRVLVFSAAVSIGTGIAFGLLPALSAARADLHDSLKDRGRGAAGGRGSERIRRALVTAQVALAVMLMVGAGLLVRSFRELTGVHLGYDPDHVLTAQLRVDGAQYDSSSAVNGFYDAVLGSIARAPGVEAVGASMSVPTQGRSSTWLFPEGAADGPDTRRDVGYSMVRGDYFKALRIPIVAGRAFDETDAPGKPPVAMINQSAAQLYYPNGNAVGSRMRIGPNPAAPWITIVGIVGDIRDVENSLPPAPTIYDNARQQTWWRSLSVVVRTSGDPMAAAPAIRAALKQADPTLALRDVAPLDDVIGMSLSARRFALGLAAGFALLALVLAAVGIYGVLAYSVNARTREFGVRLALGATGSNVMTLVLREGLTWSVAGLAIGIAGALAFGRVLASSLFGVHPGDAATFIAVSLCLVVVAVAACIIPAARATRVDPIKSLRAE
jgi:putative ABC transport system permease protein